MLCALGLRCGGFGLKPPNGGLGCTLGQTGLISGWVVLDPCSLRSGSGHSHGARRKIIRDNRGLTGNILSGPHGRLSRSSLCRSCRRGLDGRGRIALWGLVLLLGRVLLRSGRLLRRGILLLVATSRCRRIVLPVRINSLLRLAIPWRLRITISLLRIAALWVTLGACRRRGHLLLSGRTGLLVGLLLRPLGSSPHLGVVVLLPRSVAAPETKAAGTQERVQKPLSETESLQGRDHCYC